MTMLVLADDVICCLPGPLPLRRSQQEDPPLYPVTGLAAIGL